MYEGFFFFNFPKRFNVFIDEKEANLSIIHILLQKYDWYATFIMVVFMSMNDLNNAQNS